MADSRTVAGKMKVKCGIFGSTNKLGSVHKAMGAFQRDTRAKLMEVPMTKAGIIYTIKY